MLRQEILMIGFRRIEFAAGLDRCHHRDAESMRLIELGDIGAGTVRLLRSVWKDR